MATTPTLRAKIDAGAWTTGAITATYSQTVSLSLASTAGYSSIRWEIFGFPPSWPCPAGWSTDPDNRIYYVVTDSSPPPAFALPALGTWGKWLLAAYPTSDDSARDIATAIEIVSPHGLHATPGHEGAQFGGAYESWARDLEANWRLVESTVVGPALPGGTGTVRVDGGVASAPDYVQVGTNPAGAGALRTANASVAVAARDAANAADLTLVSSDASDTAILGATGKPTKVNGSTITLSSAAIAPGYKAPTSTAFQFSSASVAVTDGADTVLSTSQYNCHDLTFTGALTANRNVIVPLTAGGTWRGINATTGGFSVTIKGATGTGVTVATGSTAIARADGTNVVLIGSSGGGGGGSTPTGTGFRHVTAGVEDAAAALVTNADVDAAAAIVPTKLSLGAANRLLWSDGATNQWTPFPIASRFDVTGSYRVNGTQALGFSGTVLQVGNQTTWTSLLTDVGAACTLDYAWGGTTYLTLSQAAAAVTASVAAGASSFTLQHAQDATTSGGNFTIKAQDAAGGGNGGLLILAAGDKDAAGTPGYIAFYCYGANQYYVSCGTGGLLLAPDKDAGAVTMQQVANTTNSATASNTTLQAQNATGTTAVGGDLTCASGTGTSRAGNLFLTASGSGGTAGYVACTSNNQEIWRCAVDGTFLVKYAGSQIMASDTSSQIGIKSLKGLAGNPFKLAYLDKSIAAGGTITLANTEYDYADINLSGAQASATTVVFPATIGATWRVTNNATAAYGVALQASGGSRLVHVGRAQTVEVRCDGAELYVVNGKPPVVVLAEGLIDYNGTSGTNTDTTLYTFPANAFGIITSVELVLDTAQTGATSVCTLTVGDTAGGTQWIVSQTINTSTAVDTDYGLTLTHLGTNFDAARGYVYVKPRATSKSIIARCARSVATVTAGKLRYRVIGSVNWL